MNVMALRRLTRFLLFVSAAGGDEDTEFELVSESDDVSSDDFLSDKTTKLLLIIYEHLRVFVC